MVGNPVFSVSETFYGKAGVVGMRIAIGCDHGALELKEEVKRVLAEYPEIETADMGVYTPEAVDYPDMAVKVCAEITAGRAEQGILLCGTGIGISIAANKIPGIRAALCGDVYSAKMARQHNDANVLALGGRVLGFGVAGEILRAWLSAAFAGGRHARRVEKIMALEGR